MFVEDPLKREHKHGYQGPHQTQRTKFQMSKECFPNNKSATPLKELCFLQTKGGNVWHDPQTQHNYLRVSF